MAMKRVAPRYPRNAARDGIEGWVQLELSIGPDGHVVSARVLESDPPGVFDSSALQAFRQWEYCPPSDTIPYPETFKQVAEFHLSAGE